MSTDLKNFIINEEIRGAHAAKFLHYQDNFHADISTDLNAIFSKEWTKLVTKFSATGPDANRKEEMLFKNPEAFTGIQFSTKDVSVGQGRWIYAKRSSISVVISHAYSDDQRRSMIHQFLDVSKSAFEKLIKNNQKAFNIVYSSGKIENIFLVKTGDDQTVKLQFKSANKEVNSKGQKTSTDLIKTIFMVGVEHGKKESKKKNFDRIFLVDYLK